jgi:hypothetical protein
MVGGGGGAKNEESLEDEEFVGEGGECMRLIMGATGCRSVDSRMLSSESEFCSLSEFGSLSEFLESLCSSREEVCSEDDSGEVESEDNNEGEREGV